MKRARDIREQLVSLMERVEITLESCSDDDVPLRKAITAGYFYNVAQLSKPSEGAYKTVKQRHDVYIHPGSGTAHFSNQFRNSLNCWQPSPGHVSWVVLFSSRVANFFNVPCKCFKVGRDWGCDRAVRS
jgi:hypothetical protein